VSLEQKPQTNKEKIVEFLKNLWKVGRVVNDVVAGIQGILVLVTVLVVLGSVGAGGWYVYTFVEDTKAAFGVAGEAFAEQRAQFVSRVEELERGRQALLEEVADFKVDKEALEERVAQLAAAFDEAKEEILSAIDLVSPRSLDRAKGVIEGGAQKVFELFGDGGAPLSEGD